MIQSTFLLFSRIWLRISKAFFCYESMRYFHGKVIIKSPCQCIYKSLKICGISFQSIVLLLSFGHVWVAFEEPIPSVWTSRKNTFEGINPNTNGFCSPTQINTLNRGMGLIRYLLSNA